MLNTKNLLDKTQAFPYGEETFEKLMDRERTIRTQFQIDLQDRGKKNLANGEYSAHKPCRYLAVESLPYVIEGVMALLNRVTTKTARKDKQYIVTLETQPWLEFCAIAFTTIVDASSRRDHKARVVESIASNCEVEAKWRHYAEYESHLFDRILEQQHKSGSHMTHINAVLSVAMNRRAAGRYGSEPKPELVWTPWTNEYRIWLGSTLFDIVCSTTGLFIENNDFMSNSSKNSISRVHSTEKFDTYIKDTEARIGLYGGFYLPLPVPPRDWTTTQNGGFWTVYGGQKKLIKNWSAGYQEEMLNMTEQLQETVFPAVNTAQHTAWRINQRVYEVMRTLWDDNSAIAGLPEQEDYPLPVCPKCGQIPGDNHPCFADPSGSKKKGAINTNPVLRAWKSAAAEVHRKNVRLKSLRLSMSYGLDVVRLIENDERFYYVYQVDFRGRLYPCGQLTPQGTDWQKGLLEFADGVALGEHGAKWLAVHLANTWGNDKVSFEERHQWVIDNEHWILECAENPLDYTEWSKADEPFCFLAGCFEWAQYKKGGNTFSSHLAVALDGSCSGIQHYSAMLRDEVGAIATNVKRTGDISGKNDIYADVANAAIELIQKDVADAEVGGYATFILAHSLLNRKVVKRAVMTLPYGSKYQSCYRYVSDELTTSLEKFNDIDNDFALELIKYATNRIWSAIPLVVQAAREGMAYLQKLARLFATQALPITWQTPTGFMVQQSYFDSSKRVIQLSTGGSITLKNDIPVWQTGNRNQITFQERSTRTIDPRRQVSGIAPNFVHSLDASHLMFSVKDAKAHGINNLALIHDSLGTHAGHTEEFSQIIRENFYKLYAEHTPLEALTTHLLSQLEEEQRGKAPEMPVMGNLNLEDIRSAFYLFA